MQSLGKTVGRCKNMVFVCFFVSFLPRSEAGALFFSMVTYFEQVLCHGLGVDFDTVYTTFFQH